MAKFIHRTNFQLIYSGNSPDYTEPTWKLIDAATYNDLAVEPAKYRTIVSDVARVMTAQEKTDYDTANPDPTPVSQPVTVTDNHVVVSPALHNIGPRSFLFSHNFCDATTWFGDATRVTAEAVGTGDAVQTVFGLANTNIIDLVHGKVTDEDLAVPTAAQTGTDFKVHVYLDAVEQTETPWLGSTADYSVNYATGDITFVVAPASAVAVTADYFYESGSTVYIKPPIGYKTILTRAEVQFSKDMVMNDNLTSAVYTYDPGQGAPPAKFEYPGSKTTFKRIYDFINYTNGSFPIIPVMGGANRGVANDILQLRWEYTSAIELPDSAGAELRIWLDTNTAYTGEIGAIAFYGYDELE